MGSRNVHVFGNANGGINNVKDLEWGAAETRMNGGSVHYFLIWASSEFVADKHRQCIRQCRQIYTVYMYIDIYIESFAKL